MSLGNLARWLGGGAAILILTGCAGTGKQTSGQNCQLQTVVQFPVTISRYNEILTPATVNGHETVLLIDTGAYHISLFDFALERLGIRYSSPSLGGYGGGLGGMAGIGSVRLDNLSFGGLSIGPVNVEVIVRDASAKKAEKEGLQKLSTMPLGLLGDDFFSRADLEFDLADGQVLMFTPHPCRGQVQHWPGILFSVPFRMDERETNSRGEVTRAHEDDYMITLPITVGGRTTTAWLDSGASPNYMTWRVANRLGVMKNTPGVKALGTTFGADGHPLTTYGYIFPNFVIGDETLVNVPVIIGDAPHVRGTMANAFLLGADFLERNRVYIAYKERMIYFTPYAFKYADGGAGK